MVRIAPVFDVKNYILHHGPLETVLGAGRTIPLKRDFS